MYNIFSKAKDKLPTSTLRLADQKRKQALNAIHAQEHFSAMDNFSLAKLAESIAPRESQVNAISSDLPPLKTPQRRARYSDKQRIRLKDAKKWAFERTGCSNTAEIKKYLQLLGKKLDLRLTSAWLAIVRELATLVNNLRTQATTLFKVGDRVRFIEYKPTQAYLQQWEPFSVVAIVNGTAKLDLLAFPVSINELKIAS